MMLELVDIHAGYGKVRVLHAIHLHLEQGEVLSLIGANGAGKSSLLKMISGLLPPSQGSVLFLGQEMAKRRPDEIVKAGIGHVPEGRQIFAGLTVRQNLLLGTYVHGPKKSELEGLYASVLSLFPILRKRFSGKAGTLSGGEQQMLAIGRALMSAPKLLLLDEPSMGLAPIVVQQIMGIVGELRSKGIPILLVEQNMTAALKVADRAYILETGRITGHGKARTLLENHDVRKKYLGM